MSAVKWLGLWPFRFLFAVVWVVAGPVLGLIVGYKICIWWVVPGWVRDYPHDGQLGLGVMMYAAGGAVVGLISSLLLGIGLVTFLRRRGTSDQGEEA